MTDQPRPFQFGLKDIFAVTAVVALVLGLLPAASRSPAAAIGFYVVCGLLQIGCYGLVFWRFQTTNLGPQPPNRQPYELARLTTLFTLGTWWITVVWLLAWWLNIELIFSLSIGLVLALFGSVLHLPVFFPNVVALMMMTRDRSAHWPLTALCLLNLLNTLLMFTAMFVLVSDAFARV